MFTEKEKMENYKNYLDFLKGSGELPLAYFEFIESLEAESFED